MITHLNPNPNHVPLVKLKHDKQIEKVVSEYETASALDKSRYDKKVQSLKDRLDDSIQKLAQEKTVWETKLAKANSELNEAKDEVYLQKGRYRKLVQQHLNEVNENEEILKNYND
eukprot:scaffold3376_cov38-Cyclotella_meneghiniana.AAC.3